MYHIVTPRLSPSELPNECAIRQLWPADESTLNHTDDYVAVREDLDRFNYAAEETRADQTVQVAEGLLDEKQQFSLSSFLSRVAAVQGSADLISLSFGKKRNAFLILILILVLSLIGTFGLELHSEVLSNLDFLWLIFPLSVSAAVGLFLVVQRLRIENQFWVFTSGHRVQPVVVWSEKRTEAGRFAPHRGICFSRLHC